ncbi:hypothetical protein NUM3379_18680 [Kineococcus sp. NUM-3379]
MLLGPDRGRQVRDVGALAVDLHRHLPPVVQAAAVGRREAPGAEHHLPHTGADMPPQNLIQPDVDAVAVEWAEDRALDTADRRSAHREPDGNQKARAPTRRLMHRSLTYPATIRLRLPAGAITAGTKRPRLPRSG